MTPSRPRPSSSTAQPRAPACRQPSQTQVPDKDRPGRVVLVDGAEHQLDVILAEAARRAVTVHVVIDLIHVLESIWKAAWSLYDVGDPAAEDRVAARALAVLAGDSTRAAQEITAEAGSVGLPPGRRTGADAVSAT